MGRRPDPNKRPHSHLTTHLPRTADLQLCAGVRAAWPPCKHDLPADRGGFHLSRGDAAWPKDLTERNRAAPGLLSRRRCAQLVACRHRRNPTDRLMMNDEAAPVQKNGGDESALHMGVAIAHFIQKFFPDVCSWRGAKMLEPRRKPSEFRTNFQRLASGSKKGANLGCVLNKIDQSASRNKVPSAKNIEGLPRGSRAHRACVPRRCREGSATRYAANTYGNVFISTT